jgi:hypothetical protein
MGAVHPIADPEIALAVAAREAPIPAGVKAYTQIEGLLGEEASLLELAKEHRREEHRQRLHEVTRELDRIREHLLQRAERLGDYRHLEAET